MEPFFDANVELVGWLDYDAEEGEASHIWELLGQVLH